MDVQKNIFFFFALKGSLDWPKFFYLSCVSNEPSDDFHSLGMCWKAGTASDRFQQHSALWWNKFFWSARWAHLFLKYAVVSFLLAWLILLSVETNMHGSGKVIIFGPCSTYSQKIVQISEPKSQKSQSLYLVYDGTLKIFSRTTVMNHTLFFTLFFI